LSPHHAIFSAMAWPLSRLVNMPVSCILVFEEW
jgi:hypothetical protein